ncbi:MAG: hypothetical protein BGO43_07945 [Gammaproteobacteria bacterium 39-13]|nr:hypothetical protein [Gammaproteobacteria bacterium]OJV93100.1 MAG: hypothetical protein BGO43_07945 [Gammaproteobacteria bacterium 39-13]
MNKENLIDVTDDIPPKENQISLTLPKSQLMNVEKSADPQDEYGALLSDLILLALPSPSQHLH